MLDTSNEVIDYVEAEIENETENLELNLSESETTELIDWIEHLSRIGSTCIKKSFLKEFEPCSSSNLDTSQSRILNEKCLKKYFEDFSIKNRNKFKNENSFGLIDENDYLAKWQNIDTWRNAYLDYTKNVCNIQSSKQLWTVEIFYFPYKNQKIKELRTRDLNATSQSAISVIFSYNASGDNMETFFVFPVDFNNRSASSNNYLFKQNLQKATPSKIGNNIDSQVFEWWLSKCFLPYATGVNKDKTNLILYQGSLPIVNSKVTKICNSNESKVKLFAVPKEELMPGNFLFSKNIRSRKIDLLKSSWKQTVYTFASSRNLKCSSAEDFFNLFIDSFQNCMEEINKSNDRSTNNLIENTNMSKFELKMIDSFYFCKFWPIF